MADLQTFESMLERGQDSALVRYCLGNEYAKLRQLDKAVEHLQKAIQQDPKYSGAWKLLGKTLAAANRKEEAAQAFENGIRAANEKGDVQAAKEMAVYLKRLQNPKA